MNYKDYSILTDTEYAKIASHYKTGDQTASNPISETYSLLQKCKSCLFYSGSFQNYQILKELNQHKNVLSKLEENLQVYFNIKQQNINTITEFNLFNYLQYLFELNTNLNKLLNKDLKQVNNLLLKPFIKDIENIILSLLKILSKLNIHIFKFM